MKKVLFFVLTFTLIFISSCKKEQITDTPKQTAFLDLDELRHRGRIIAVTDFNSTNYFIYKGQPMGFHYELLKSFSNYIGLNIEIIPQNDLRKSIEMLNSGEADLLAVDLTITSLREKQLRYTEPVYQTRQVLVQRKPNRWTAMTSDEINRSLIRSQLDLAGKSIYVQAGSSSVETLRSLRYQIGDSLAIIEVPYESEELIKLVARREIDYVVCDENVAKVNAGYYPIIDVLTPVSFTQNLSWGLRSSNSGRLAAAFNEWIASYKQTRDYALLYAKYYRNVWSAYIYKSDYYTLNTGKISPWDVLIKSFSDTINWDWRLLASMMYQESRFIPDVRSWAGAYGLMQIMPSTGRHLGIDITSSPENNVKAGVFYLRFLQDYFKDKIPDENERVKFILAAYNAGTGNIDDAMELAKKHGRDPLVWDENVEYFLLKKMDPAYYNDPVVKHGYCKGDEPVNYVAQILERYSNYRNIIPLTKD